MAFSPLGDVPANIVLAGRARRSSRYKFSRRQNCARADPLQLPSVGERLTCLPRDNPYVDISAADGTFCIAKLPVGRWEFQAWHEKAGGSTRREWPKGRFTATIKPGNERPGHDQDRAGDAGKKVKPHVGQSVHSAERRPKVGRERRDDGSLLPLNAAMQSTACIALSPLILSLLATGFGCSMSAPPQFRLNTEGRDAAAISPRQAEAITETLSNAVRHARRPVVPDGVDLRLELLQAAAGPIGGDAEGNQWGLFRRHCAGCHGISGDGAGPAAAVLDPYPRDFRNGVFKYTSTAGGAKPLRETCSARCGRASAARPCPRSASCPPGNSTHWWNTSSISPSAARRNCICFSLVVDEDASLPLDMDEVMSTKGVQPAAESWDDARAMAVVPPAPPVDRFARSGSAPVDRPGPRAVRRRGAQCVKCHGPRATAAASSRSCTTIGTSGSWGPRRSETRELAGRFRLPVERAAAAGLHARSVSRRRPADRPVLADLRGNQGDADAAGRPLAGQPRAC